MQPLACPLSLLSIVALVAGCARPYATPAYDSSPPSKPSDIAFHGIVDELGAKPLDVLLVHGMCTHDEKWAKDAVESLYKAAGGGPDQVELTPSIVPDTDIQLFQQTLRTVHGELRANAIVWSRMTTPLKKQLCFDQTVKLRERWGYPVIDVVTSNADTYVGFVERPDRAHTDYSLNRTVEDHIACGKPSSTRCKR